MNASIGSYDHRENEFYTYRYTTSIKKGDILEIRTGTDLEVARFQARKVFPDVLNEYWWLKPSDVSALKGIPLQVNDVIFYHGGIPVAVMLSAQGAISRKAQIFLKKRDDSKYKLTPEEEAIADKLTVDELSKLLEDQNLLLRLKALSVLRDKYPGTLPTSTEAMITYHILSGEYPLVIQLGEQAIDPLIERFFVTSQAKESEKILEALIAIGSPSISRLEDMSEYLSDMASPFYAKRIQWTIKQIKSRKRVS